MSNAATDRKSEHTANLAALAAVVAQYRKFNEALAARLGLKAVRR